MKVAINIKPLLDDNRFRGVGSYTRNLITYLKKTPTEVIEFEDFTQVGKVDLVHYPFFNPFFRTLPLRSKIPIVVTIHDVMPLLFPDNYPVGIRGKVNLQLQKLSLKNCRRVITDADVSKKDISKLLDVSPGKIDVIPLAAGDEFKILPKVVTQKVKAKLELPDKFILYAGDVNYVKNLPSLIKAFFKIKKNNDDLKLVLVGGSFLKEVSNNVHPELESLRMVNRLIEEHKIDRDVIRLGQIDVEDLVAIYNLAAFYIQPSLYEGFGIPLLEAMKCGCPVISSNTGSLLEVGRDAVLYFDPLNIDDLVNCMLNLLSDGVLRNKVIKKGFERSADFSWQKTVQQTIEVYEKSF